MNWQDVRRIVEIADKMLVPCQMFGWDEREYYENILREYSKDEISTGE